MPITSPNIDRFSKFIHSGFITECAIELSLIIPPHLKGVAALPCETSISENWRKFDARIVINDKSQGSVTIRLRCGGLYSNYFTTDLLLSLLVKFFLKSVNIWRSYRQEVADRPLIIYKSILLQYLFLCIAGDTYCHVGFFVWLLCVSFIQ